MGTNYYWASPRTKTKGITAGAHIGKRSAAGFYCWDCEATLCRGGIKGVHYSKHEWADVCPVCGNAKIDESLDESPVGVELGFAKSRQQRPTGVRGCSSFSWAIHPKQVISICRKNPKRKLIKNEYGDSFTCSEFLDMLNCNCPIEYTDLIGEEFS